MMYFPLLSMNPTLALTFCPSIFPTAVRPSENHPASSNCGLMTYLPCLLMNPTLTLPPPRPTDASPSWNRKATSNCGLMAYSPVLSMNPHRSPIFTAANPSEKRPAPSNWGWMTNLPVVSIKPQLFPCFTGKEMISSLNIFSLNFEKLSQAATLKIKLKLKMITHNFLKRSIANPPPCF